MTFRDRQHAAALLAERLKEYRGRNPLVLGVPRGGVVMADVIATALGGEVDVVLVHKLGAPGQPEFAIGAVDESGRTVLSSAVERLGIRDGYLRQEREEQLRVMRERRATYTPVRPPISPAGRVVIVVDDGLATGATMVAALQALRAAKPGKLIAATAVAPADTAGRVGELADAFVCLEIPEVFYAVGQFFEDFSQVEDREVIQVLARHAGPGNKAKGR